MVENEDVPGGAFFLKNSRSLDCNYNVRFSPVSGDDIKFFVNNSGTVDDVINISSTDRLAALDRLRPVAIGRKKSEISRFIQLSCIL